MPVTWTHEGQKLLVYRVSGEMSIAEMAAAETASRELLASADGWEVLVLLENFAGWSDEAGWADSMLFEETDARVAWMAVVGPLEWRDQVEIFMLKGMRPVEIEYFTAADEPRSWLGAD